MADLTKLQNPEIIAITDGNADGPVQVLTVGSNTCLAVTGFGTFTVNISNTPTVVANAGTGTFTTSPTGTQTVAFSTGTGTVVLSGNTNTVVANAGSGTFTVSVSNTATVVSNAGSGTFTVSSLANTAATATGSITTSSTSITATVTNYTYAVVTVHGTYAGVTFGFNLSDDGGTTYYPALALSSNFTVIGQSVTPGTNASVMYLVPCGGATTIQVLSSAFTSGSASIRITPTNDSTNPFVYVTNTVPVTASGTFTTSPTGTQTVSVSNTPTVVANAGTGTFTTSPTGTQTVAFSTGTGTVVLSGNTNTVVANAGTGTFTAVLSGNTNTVVANAGSGTFTVSDLANTAATATGTITTAASAVTATVTNYTYALVTVHGTYAGVTFGVNLSDDGGTTYYPIQALNSNYQVIGQSLTPGTNASAMYLVPVSGGTTVQVLASAYTSGTANIRITPINSPINPFTYVTNTIPVSGTITTTPTGTQTVSVSNTPTVVANAGSGTFTTSPTGTQTVAPTGTQTVAFSTGTGTVVLSGNTNTVVANAGSGTFTVSVSNTATVVANAGSGTYTVSALANAATTATGTITTAASAVTATVTNYTYALVTLHGTYAGVTFGVNLSDDGGTTYYPAQALTSNFTLIGQSLTPGTNASVAYLVPVGGATTVQILASAYTSGTANVRITPINNPTNPFVWVTNTVPISGTITSTPTGTQTVSVSNTPTVVANAGSGTFTTSPTGTQTVAFSTGTGTVVLSGNTNTVVANAGSGTFTAVLSGNTNTVVANAGSGTFTVSELANSATTTTGTITTAASSITATVTNYTYALVTVHGTYAGVIFGFNLSDDGGTTYYPIQALSSNFTVIGQSVTPGTNATTMYLVPVAGGTTVQVLASAYTSGTANIRITPINSPNNPFVYVTNTIPVSGTITTSPTGTQTVSVSNTPTVVANAGSGTFTTSPTGTQTVAPTGTQTVAFSTGTGTVVLSGATNTVVANAGSGTFTVITQPNSAATTTGTITTAASSITATVSNYNYAIVTVHGTYAGVTFGFSLSDDGGTTYYNVAGMNSTGSGVAQSVSPGTNGSIMYYVPCGGATTLRVLASAYTSGTANIRITPTDDPSQPFVFITNQITTTPTGTQTVAFSTGTGTMVLSGNTNTVVANAGSGTFTVSTLANTATTNTGTITTAASSIVTTVTNYTYAIVTVHGTYAGVTFGFNLSDDSGTTYYATQAIASNSNTFGTSVTPGTNASAMYLVPCAGCTTLQILASAYTSGTANIRVTPTNSPNNPFAYVTNTISATISGTTTVVGNVAAAAADSGNPVKVGGVTYTTLPAVATGSQRQNLMCDKLGRLSVGFQPREMTVHATMSLTTTAETTLLAAGGAGVFLDISSIFILDTSANGANMYFRDSTGGTIRWVMGAQMNANQYNAPTSHTFPVPLTQTTANNNWTVQAAIAPATGNPIYVSIVAIQNS
jgi:trimeric autotransporter adhesin